MASISYIMPKITKMGDNSSLNIIIIPYNISENKKALQYYVYDETFLSPKKIDNHLVRKDKRFFL